MFLRRKSIRPPDPPPPARPRPPVRALSPIERDLLAYLARRQREKWAEVLSPSR